MSRGLRSRSVDRSRFSLLIFPFSIPFCPPVHEVPLGNLLLTTHPFLVPVPVPTNADSSRNLIFATARSNHRIRCS